MRYLGLALFAEGPSDHRFLRPLLRRLCERLCVREAQQTVEIGEVVELHSPADMRGESREERICRAAERAAGAWHVLFIHTDAAGDPTIAREERVLPATECLRDRLAHEHGCVAVIPVRETEAWLLADPAGLLEAFGVSDFGQTVPPTTPSRVESVGDPKRKLEQVFRECVNRGRVGSYFDLLGERISLQALGEVPAFQELVRELSATLRTLHITG